MNAHHLYAIYFFDGRVKLGITGQLQRRMSYYRQEAVRNRISGFNWCAFKPFAHRADALRAESALCQAFRSLAIQGHREWFEMSANDFGVVLTACERLRVDMAGDDEDKAEVPWLGVSGKVSCAQVVA